MSIGDDETGRSGASRGTHAEDFAGDGAPGASSAAGRDQVDAIAADVARIAGALERPAGDQLDLLAGSLDLGDEDAISAAANLVAEPRRARGRPAGSGNKRNTAVFDYLEALGHRDPAVTLSMIQSADTKALAKAIGADTAKGRMAVLALQKQAAAELMPYKYAKRPQELQLPAGDKRPFMVIGELNGNIVADGGFMSVGDPRAQKANEIKGSAVRLREGESHEDGQAVDVPHETPPDAPD